MPRGIPQKDAELSEDESDDVAFSDEEISSQEFVESTAKLSRNPTNVMNIDGL